MNDQATTDETKPTTKIARIEEKLDHGILADVAATSGGISFRTMTEIMEFAKLMSLAGVAVPPHLRGNPGACLAVTIQAQEWRMSPFAVAGKSYVVSNYSKEGPIERLSYESQLIHAVIEARAPLQGRLRVEYEGEGDERVCIVSGMFRGETQPHELRSSPLGKRRPGLNEKGYSKGSPLWYSKPDLQQFYDTSRDWCRMYCPDVLMGIYAPDEFEELEPIEPKDVSPKLIERLAGKSNALEQEAVTDALKTHTNEPEKAKGKRGRKKAADKVADAATSPEPKTASEYAIYAEDWIEKIASADEADKQWEGETEMREKLSVPVKERLRLKKLIEDKADDKS